MHHTINVLLNAIHILLETDVSQSLHWHSHCVPPLLLNRPCTTHTQCLAEHNTHLTKDRVKLKPSLAMASYSAFAPGETLLLDKPCTRHNQWLADHNVHFNRYTIKLKIAPAMALHLACAPGSPLHNTWSMFSWTPGLALHNCKSAEGCASNGIMLCYCIHCIRNRIQYVTLSWQVCSRKLLRRYAIASRIMNRLLALVLGKVAGITQWAITGMQVCFESCNLTAYRSLIKSACWAGTEAPAR